MIANDFTQSNTTHAFNSFINMFDNSPSIFSKARSIIGIQKNKFDDAERAIFEKFISNFITRNYGILDQKTLIKMMELSSDIDVVNYDAIKIPVENLEILPTNYVEFS